MELLYQQRTWRFTKVSEVELFLFVIATVTVVTQSMPTTPAQSSTSLWSIVLPVSILVAISPHLHKVWTRPIIRAIIAVIAIIVAIYMPYTYYVPPCSVFDPTVTKPIDEYASELREKYDRTLTRYKDPNINKYPAAGPTAPTVPFIPLKLIRLKSYQKKVDAEFLHSVDKKIIELDNFEKIEIYDILKPLRNRQLRFVLIEGEPGIGKSTLAKELTLRWVRQTDAFLTDYKIVILISLRFEIYQKAKTTKELLIDVDDINMTEVMLSINETRGADVLWILDGFDELPHHLRNSSTSIFIKLIKGDILPKSTVIVTSRHAATEPLLTFLENDSKHIVLRGFGSNEMLEYASNYFKNDTIVSEFHSYYSGNTVIESMMYNPMNCFIMCKVFTDFIHTKNNKYPITMTAIYNYYVRALLKRHLIDTKEIDINYEMPPHLIQKIDFNNPVLSSYWEHFYDLSEVAYNGVTKQKYIFGKELHGIPKLSMMDTIFSFTGFDKDESSSFIHTALQEYFAAIYLINNLHLRFTEIDIQQNSNLEDVFIFYIGLSKYIDKEIGTSNMLRTDVIHDDVYRSNKMYLQISSLWLRCLYENDLLLHNKDYNLDSGQTWSIADLPINNFDYFIAGYIVAAHNITFRISVSHLTELATFRKGLQFRKTSVNGKIIIKLPRLYLSSDPIAELDLPSNAVIGLHLMLKLDSSICQIISKFSLLEELLIIINHKFDCYSTVLEHPLMKLNKLERLTIAITIYNYNRILKLFKQLVIPGRPLKQLFLLVPIKIINTDMYTQILDSALQSSLDELRIHVLSEVTVFSESTFKYKYNEALEIILNIEENSLTVNYYQLFVYLLGATHKIHLSSFTSFVYYKVKYEMVHRLEITIYSEPKTSLDKFISAFVNCTSTLKLTRNLYLADYIKSNYKIKLNGSMYAVVSLADPVLYEADTTATDYTLYMKSENFVKFLMETLLDYAPISIAGYEENPGILLIINFIAINSCYLLMILSFFMGLVFCNSSICIFILLLLLSL